MAEDAAPFVRNDRTIHLSGIEPVRVALTGDQVEQHDLPTAPAKPTDLRSRTWEGGTCQLEALPPDVLAEIVGDAIAAAFDVEVLERTLDEEHRERAEVLGLPPGQED